MKNPQEITDDEVVNAMLEYGGRFMQQIGSTFRHADPDNRQKIKVTWSDEWAKYQEFARIAKAQHGQHADDGEPVNADVRIDMFGKH